MKPIRWDRRRKQQKVSDGGREKEKIRPTKPGERKSEIKAERRQTKPVKEKPGDWEIFPDVSEKQGEF